MKSYFLADNQVDIVTEFKVASILTSSTVDWRGKIVAIIFFRGCDFECPYCQNYPLLEPGDNMEPGEVEDTLRRDAWFLDGVVLSGGEPLLQLDGVSYFFRFSRGLDLACGLQTNGNRPEALSTLLEEGLIDGLFIDVKTRLQPGYYESVCGVSEEDITVRVRESIKLGIKARRDGILNYLEARTTVFPGISDSPDDISAIAGEVKGVDRFVLQQGRPESAPETFSRDGRPTSREKLLSLAAVAKRLLPTVGVRSHAGGEEDV